jgi:TPR repeat protein
MKPPQHSHLLIFTLTLMLAGCRTPPAQSELIARLEKKAQARQAATVQLAATQLASLRTKAEKGDTQAQFAVAEHYAIDHEGMPKNSPEAVRWMRLAAEQGLDKAQLRLGWWYHGGAVAGATGVLPKDWVEAAKWYRLAAERKNGNACTMLGVLLSQGGNGLQKDSVAAVGWWRKGAELGDPLGQVNLGASYQFGSGVEKDSLEAVKWYRQAAEQGDDNGQFHLARCYEAGEGVPKDLVLADMWLQIIANTSDDLLGIVDVLVDAQTRVEAQMTHDQIAEAKLRARHFKPAKAATTLVQK